jgi:hypothetical protein
VFKTTLKQQEAAMATTIEEQVLMFDFPIADLDAFLAEKTPAEMPMVIISKLSDVQAMIEMDLPKETIRRALNRVKYYVDHLLR